MALPNWPPEWYSYTQTLIECEPGSPADKLLTALAFDGNEQINELMRIVESDGQPE